MTIKKIKHSGFLAGLLFGLIVMTLFLLTLSLSGYVVITGSLASIFNLLLYWIYENLSWSVIPFSLILFFYGYYIKVLKDILEIEDVNAAKVEEYNQKLEKLITLFFGVGVLWTAIGMRSSLTAALGDVDSTVAASLGAWEILSRLVDGGILLALSTTIVGGAGGYLMSLGKQWFLEHKLNHFYQKIEKQQQNQVNDRLDRIAKLMEKFVEPEKKSNLA